MTKDTTLEPATNTETKTSLRCEWKPWLTAFDYFAHGKGLRKYNRQRKRALLPHLEGTDIIQAPGKAIRSHVDKRRKISTTARARKIKFTMKYLANAPAPVTVGGL